MFVARSDPPTTMHHTCHHSIYADPVEQVLEFARNAAQVSIENAESLLETLRSGDMAASRQAYLKLRPEYEQIEHLYEVFGDTDA